MRSLRILIALFSLIFLLSGVSLLLLIIDDQKDLSSRASTTILSGKKPLEGYNDDYVAKSILSPDWLEVDDDMYLSKVNGDTVRILPASTNIASLSAILGPSFKNQKKLEQIKINNTTVDKYSYDLLGETKKVNFWRDRNISFLEVGNIKNNSDLVRPLVDKIIFLRNQNVLGASTPDNWAKLATLTRPSVVTVLNHYCTELKFFSLPSFSLSDKAYPFCLTSMGTGFFVSEDGFLATNGHIVRNLQKASIYYALSGGKLDQLLADFLQVYLTEKTGKIVTEQEAVNAVSQAKLNKESLYQLGGIIIDLNQKNILKFGSEKNNYYLQLGNQAAEITDTGIKTTDTVIEANLIASDYEEAKEVEGFVSSDVAILKTNNGTFPALPLGSVEEAVVGSELQVIGFPIAASNNLAILDNSSTEPTFTKGLVSAIKLAKGNQKKLIQTDAIINHGNSGGPAILSTGNVVGIATYGVAMQDGSGSYNFLRDIQDLKDLANKNSLSFTTGKIYSDWQDGLTNYYLGYFKYALSKFQSVKNSYPQHPLVDRYLQEVSQKIGGPEDQTPFLTVPVRQMLIKLSASLLVLSFILVILFIVLAKRQSRNLAQIIQTPPTSL
ncbi:hypothetical protein A2572_03915 [Candidatus Collierbacteria bacterium RIFOXYD1_FULL_40_9]|uniref:Peptidase S1 domain-containing protein n=1 Tax=Candidatus Collierbacteria bacterium RIFOXYD1_FULL_40_9 TaxID=1817731 RepID=A0A1F5FW11_9BACT|nr:MAG: hypothetical protein A2572_03915 [Candidatus Collierbacteria bacterium RIFOXYD1_FULL_40_9]